MISAVAIVRLGQGEARTFGIDSVGVLVVGLILLVGYGLGLLITTRRRIRDPRKGMNE